MVDNTDKFKINYKSIISIDLEKLKLQYKDDADDKENEYNPFKVNSFQNYVPIYNNFFNMEESNYNDICLNNKRQIIDLETLENSGTIEKKEIFIKYSPLLDPIKYMVGKYDISDNSIRTLPNLKNKEDCHKKLLEMNNSSYVDGFFCFLSGMLLNTYNSKNFIDFYGSFLSIKNNLCKINCSNSSNSFSLIFSKFCFSKLSFKLPSINLKVFLIFL